MVEINKTLSKENDDLKSKFKPIDSLEYNYGVEIAKNKQLNIDYNKLLAHLNHINNKIKTTKWYNLGDLKKEAL